MRKLLLAFIILTFGSGAHAADRVGDPVAGKRTAYDLCRQCHDTTGSEKQSNPPGGAPAFIVVAQSKGQTPQTLRRKLMLPHGRMDNLILPGQDAENVISYIMSLHHQ